MTDSHSKPARSAERSFSASGTENAPQKTGMRSLVRVISILDTFGTRYLTTDVPALRAFGHWVLPMAVGQTVPYSDSAVSFGNPMVEGLAERLAQVDGGLTGQHINVKIGHLVNAASVDRIAAYLQDVVRRITVLDPELYDRDGRPRVDTACVESVARELLKEADALVVNRKEAGELTNREVDDPKSMRDACRALFDLGPALVVVTGGHLDRIVRDMVYDGRNFDELGADKINTNGSLRGAGSVFSATLLGALVAGFGPFEAAACARYVVTAAVKGRVAVTERGVYNAGAPNVTGPWVANPNPTVAQAENDAGRLLLNPEAFGGGFRR